MLPHRPEAISEILRAARILHVRVEAAKIGDYQPVSPRYQARDVDLDLSIIAILKGDVAAAPGDRVQIRVTQTENLGSRFTAVPGVWSRLDVDPGAEFVVFAGDGDTAGEALVEPACFRVLVADPAAHDVALASEAGCPELRLRELLARHRGREAVFGPLFGGYLVERLLEVFPDLAADLAAFLRVLETPNLPASTRFVLCFGVVGKVVLMSPVDPDLMRRVVQSLFRLLVMPEAADLHGNLVTTWIPNLVGVEGGLDRQSVDDMLPSGPVRAEAVSALHSFPDPQAAAPLLAWIGP